MEDCEDVEATSDFPLPLIVKAAGVVVSDEKKLDEVDQCSIGAADQVIVSLSWTSQFDTVLLLCLIRYVYTTSLASGLHPTWLRDVVRHGHPIPPNETDAKERLHILKLRVNAWDKFPGTRRMCKIRFIMLHINRFAWSMVNELMQVRLCCTDCVWLCHLMFTGSGCITHRVSSRDHRLLHKDLASAQAHTDRRKQGT